MTAEQKKDVLSVEDCNKIVVDAGKDIKALILDRIKVAGESQKILLIGRIVNHVFHSHYRMVVNTAAQIDEEMKEQK